tara:strand:- start:157 stop:807 length:651 start_codon:yes stop_codon:yes gene_type:complete
MKSAIVVGSTGLVGKHLINTLINSNIFDRVTALVRSPYFKDYKNIEEIVLDFNKEDPFGSLKKANHVFCCLGSTIRKAGSKKAFKFVDFDLPVLFAKWAEQNNCETFSLVSSLGADSKSKMFYNKTKGEIENEIKKFSFSKTQIFRPSLIMGKRNEFRPGELLGKGIFTLLNPLMVGTLKKYKAIHAKDIAQGMVGHLSKNQYGVKVIESNEIMIF